MELKNNKRQKANMISEKVLSFRIPKAEFEEIEKKIDELKISNLSDYLRTILRDSETKIRHVYTEDPKKLELIKELIFQIRMIGININQIAHGVNLGLSIPDDFFPWAEEKLKNISSDCKTLLSELEKDFDVRDQI